MEGENLSKKLQDLQVKQEYKRNSKHFRQMREYSED